MAQPNQLSSTFSGVVDRDGKVHLDSPAVYRQFCVGLKGEDVEVIIRKRRIQRSNPQNRYYHGVVVKTIAEHCGYQPDEMHELLAMKFLRIDDDPITGAPQRKRTPACNTKEFSEYVDDVRLWAESELGVYVPEANEAVAA